MARRDHRSVLVFPNVLQMAIGQKEGTTYQEKNTLQKGKNMNNNRGPLEI